MAGGAEIANQSNQNREKVYVFSHLQVGFFLECETRVRILVTRIRLTEVAERGM